MKFNTPLLALSLLFLACCGEEDGKKEKKPETENKQTPEGDIYAKPYTPIEKNLPLYKVQGEIVALFHHKEPAMPSQDTDYVFYKNASGTSLRTIYPDGSHKDYQIITKQKSDNNYEIRYAEEGIFNGEYFVMRMPTVLEFYNKDGKMFAEATPFELPK